MKRLMNAQQAADYLGVHYNTVTRWAQRGLIPSYHVGPRRDWRFDQADLDAHLTAPCDHPKGARCIGFGLDQCVCLSCGAPVRSAEAGEDGSPSGWVTKTHDGPPGEQMEEWGK